MTNGLERIIDLQISRETSAVSQAGFGAANFLSFTALFQERIKQYSSYSAIAEDDLAGSDTLLFASKYFGQENRPQTLYVTRKAKDAPRIITLDFVADLVTGNTIDLKINTVPIAQVTFATSHSVTMTALAAAIAALASVASATVTSGRQITITGQDSGVAIAVNDLVIAGGSSQTTGSTTVTQYEDTVATDVESLEEAQSINDDWYALATYQHSEAAIKNFAAYIQAQRKIYVASTKDADVLTSATDDVASDLKAASYDRTAIIYSADSDNYPEGAWLGGLLPKQPGSITWKFKSLSGIVVDSLNDTEKSNALSKNCNTYTVVGGTNITEEGNMSEGEFIDIIRGVDWLHARITENIYQAFVNEDKIPYTDNGVAIIVNRINQILLQGVARSVLRDNPAPTVTAPLVQNVAINDRANRILPDVTFEAQMAGAIHKTVIRGTVSV